MDWSAVAQYAATPIAFLAVAGPAAWQGVKSLNKGVALKQLALGVEAAAGRVLVAYAEGKKANPNATTLALVTAPVEAEGANLLAEYEDTIAKLGGTTRQALQARVMGAFGNSLASAVMATSPTVVVQPAAPPAADPVTKLVDVAGKTA